MAVFGEFGVFEKIWQMGMGEFVYICFCVCIFSDLVGARGTWQWGEFWRFLTKKGENV